MSSASLAVAHRSHPDRARIAAMSAAIALNLAVILIATRPINPTRLAVLQRLTPVPLVRLIDPPAVPPAPAPVELKPLPIRSPRHRFVHGHCRAGCRRSRTTRKAG